MTDKREKIRFWINGEALFTELGTTVSSLLKKSHGVEMPCGGRHACGKCMVYAEGGFAAPSETEKKFLGAERLAQGIRLACFLKAVPDGKIMFHSSLNHSRSFLHVLHKGHKYRF